ncbi:MAG: sugar ABC transporter substrate-binding protein [Pseudoclavibacter sp.]
MMKNVVLKGALATGALIGVVAMTACSGSASGGDADGGLTVGYSVAAGQNVALQAISSGLEAELSQTGGELITADAQLSIDKQIADIDSFVTQGVDAIVVTPIDFPTLSNALSRAEAAGIPLFANNAVVDRDFTADEISPFVAQVTTGRDKAASDIAQFIAEKTGGTGQVAAIGIAAPVAELDHFVSEFQADVEATPGLEFVAERGNDTDDAAGARPVADAMITEFPDLKAIMCYNDPSAVGASSAATAAGKRDQIIITGVNATQDGLDAVASGAIDATWDYMAPDQGQLLAKLIAAHMEGQELDFNYVVELQAVTPDNIDAFVSWEDRIAQIKDGSFEGLPVS